MTARSDRFLIGVHATAASQDVAGTLRAVHESTPQPFDLVILVDPAPGEEAALAAALEEAPRAPRLAPAAPGGAAAAFNQLLAQGAEVSVFLECGARPGPDWLARLLAALDGDPANGLAGPSTNRAWNEQAVSPGGSGAPAEVEREAERLWRAHGGAWRSMAPLHSLADVCLAVRAAVPAAIGGADLAYGRGPCWEMDYAARAARAGFQGVWAKGAFVHRGPAPAWRAASEGGQLAINKRLYQDRLCGRRLAGPGSEPPDLAAPYHAQCRGEACADFAPAGAIRLRLPLPSPLSPAVGPPLISCAMATRGRPRFVAQSVAYFRRQDYPNRELIIVHESDADLPDEPIADADIRLVRTGETSIGAKREVAARAARGEIIAHWDDDDWYGPQRLSAQARPILEGVADMTGFTDTMFMVIGSGEFWTVSRQLHRRLFAENVTGGTLMFRAALWRRNGPYPAISLREDVALLTRAMAQGARLCRLPSRDLFIYVRHDLNTWRFREGVFLEPGDWIRADEPESLGADRVFYLGEAAAPAAHRAGFAGGDGPLISCIMPTADRRAFAPRAIAQFLAQDHPRRELVVVDDGDDPVGDLIPDHPLIRYRRLDRRASVGEKRNLACDMAAGHIIAHWDDDDWMAPDWLSTQAATLLGQGADICGLDKVWFYAPATGEGWRYEYAGGQPWVCGGTLCYHKAYWRQVRFPHKNIGEDNGFVWAPRAKTIAVNPHHDLFVATIHPGNSSPKKTLGHPWRRAPAGRLEAMMGPAALSRLPISSPGAGP